MSKKVHGNVSSSANDRVEREQHASMNIPSAVYLNQGNVIQLGNMLGDLTNTTVYEIPVEEPICFRYQVPVEDFIGRSKELQTLHHKLLSDKNVPRNVVLVSGLGGIGKTQIVKKFYEDHKELYSNMIWIDSQNRGKIEDEFKALADKLKVKCKDFRSLTEEVFGKLSKKRTLIVFDNVENIEDIEFALKMGTVGVTPDIVITSRIQEWDDSMRQVRLNVFSSADALQYVSHQLGCSHEGKEEMVEILQNFPIALKQATAHIKYHRRVNDTYNICNYIEDYNSQRKEVLASNYFQKGVLNQYTQTTLTTWKVTIDAIKRCDEIGHLADRILNIMAYFCSDHILGKIFFKLKNSSSASSVYLTEDEVQSAVSLLINYSMIEGYAANGDYGQSVLTIHRLVQEVIKIELEKDTMSEVKILREGLRLVSEQHENFGDYYWHGISVFLSALKFEELVNDFRLFPNLVLDRLIKFGNHSLAFDFGTQILSPLTSIFGENDQQILTSKYYIACSYHKLGQHAEALQMLEEVYEKQKTILGKDHSNTIITKSVIAEAQQIKNATNCSLL